MIYITKQEGLYQNKVNSSLVSTCNCKMDYGNVILIAGTKLKFGTKNVYLKNVTFVRLNQLNVKLR